MTKPVALITGITGQDGAYLAELLLSKGYEAALPLDKAAHAAAKSMTGGVRRGYC